MMTKLKEMLDRVQNWPPEAQEEAVQSLLAIEEKVVGSPDLSDEDRATLAASANDVRLGRLATDDQVREVFARYRQA
jgi:hypothetical protein